MFFELFKILIYDLKQKFKIIFCFTRENFMIFCKYRFFRLFTYISAIYCTRVPIVRVRRLNAIGQVQNKVKVKVEVENKKSNKFYRERTDSKFIATPAIVRDIVYKMHKKRRNKMHLNRVSYVFHASLLLSRV